jgi:hypothetical protein
MLMTLFQLLKLWWLCFRIGFQRQRLRSSMLMAASMPWAAKREFTLDFTFSPLNG